MVKFPTAAEHVVNTCGWRTLTQQTTHCKNHIRHTHTHTQSGPAQERSRIQRHSICVCLKWKVLSVRSRAAALTRGRSEQQDSSEHSTTEEETSLEKHVSVGECRATNTQSVCVSVWGDHADITRSHREKPFHVSVFSLLINLHHLLRPHIPGAAGWMVEYSKYLVTILGVRKNYDFTCLSSNRQTAHILGLKHTTYRKDRLRSRPHGTEEVQEPQGCLCVKVLEGTMVL